MPFVSDEQRKAAFARMKGKGSQHRGGGTQRLPGDPIMDAIGAWLTRGKPSFTPKPNGRGIQGSSGGPVTLTGGAIYNSALSNWFIHTPAPTVLNQTPLTGITGVSFNTDISIQEFQPPTTLLGSAWYLLQGIDPGTGEFLPALNTPGTLKDPISLVYAHEQTDRNAGNYDAFIGGVGPDAIPSGLRTRSNVYNLPALIQWWEDAQDIPDWNIGGLTFSFNPSGQNGYHFLGY
jgi:hypothetical protein